MKYTYLLIAILAILLTLFGIVGFIFAMILNWASVGLIAFTSILISIILLYYLYEEKQKFE